MSDLNQILKKIESRPGAEERISANVARMNKVLELEKLRKRKQLTQTTLGRYLGLSQRRVSAIENSGIEIQLDTLNRYVESLGGTLEVTAVIDGDRIQLLTH